MHGSIEGLRGSGQRCRGFEEAVWLAFCHPPRALAAAKEVVAGGNEQAIGAGVLPCANGDTGERAELMVDRATRDGEPHFVEAVEQEHAAPGVE